MIFVMTLCCFKPSLMALLDGGGQVFVRDDFRGQFVPQHVDHIETGQQAVRIAQRQALLGQEKMGKQHQRHMVMPGQPAAHLILGHAAGALGVLQRPLNEEALAVIARASRNHVSFP
jgi:hypothetical protein